MDVRVLHGEKRRKKNLAGEYGGGNHRVGVGPTSAPSTSVIVVFWVQGQTKKK